MSDAEGAFVLFEDANAAIEARDEIAENLRGEIKDISAESAKFEARSIELQKELDDAAILVSNLRAEVNALREG